MTIKYLNKDKLCPLIFMFILLSFIFDMEELLHNWYKNIACFDKIFIVYVSNLIHFNTTIFTQFFTRNVLAQHKYSTIFPIAHIAKYK